MLNFSLSSTTNKKPFLLKWGGAQSNPLTIIGPYKGARIDGVVILPGSSNFRFGKQKRGRGRVPLHTVLNSNKLFTTNGLKKVTTKESKYIVETESIRLHAIASFKMIDTFEKRKVFNEILHFNYLYKLDVQ